MPKYKINVRAIVKGDHDSNVAPEWNVYDIKDGVIRADTVVEVTADSIVSATLDAIEVAPSMDMGDADVELWVDQPIDVDQIFTEPKMVSFDFIMDTFVAVDAPEGTDPDTLVDQAKEKFRERLADGSAIVMFDKIFDEE